MDETAESRLQALIDKEAIRDTIYTYAQAVDRWDRHLYASVFAPDAVLHLGVYDGPASAMFSRPRAEGLVTTHHALGNIRVKLEGDRAKAVTYISAIHRKWHGDELVDELFRARYLDVFVRLPEGWRISERTSVRDWSCKVPASDAHLPDAQGASAYFGKDGADDPGFGFLD